MCLEALFNHQSLYSLFFYLSLQVVCPCVLVPILVYGSLGGADQRLFYVVLASAVGIGLLFTMRSIVFVLSVIVTTSSTVSPGPPCLAH